MVKLALANTARQTPSGDVVHNANCSMSRCRCRDETCVEIGESFVWSLLQEGGSSIACCGARLSRLNGESERGGESAALSFLLHFLFPYYLVGITIRYLQDIKITCI